MGSQDEAAHSTPPAGGFLFEGIEVEAFRSDSRWHLRAAGHEAISEHLGEAARVLFNPSFHDDTGSLIEAILASESEQADPPPVPSATGEAGAILQSSFEADAA